MSTSSLEVRRAVLMVQQRRTSTSSTPAPAAGNSAVDSTVQVLANDSGRQGPPLIQEPVEATPRQLKLAATSFKSMMAVAERVLEASSMLEDCLDALSIFAGEKGVTLPTDATVVGGGATTTRLPPSQWGVTAAQPRTGPLSALQDYFVGDAGVSLHNTLEQAILFLDNPLTSNQQRKAMGGNYRNLLKPLMTAIDVLLSSTTLRDNYYTPIAPAARTSEESKSESSELERQLRQTLLEECSKSKFDIDMPVVRALDAALKSMSKSYAKATTKTMGPDHPAKNLANASTCQLQDGFHHRGRASATDITACVLLDAFMDDLMNLMSGSVVTNERESASEISEVLSVLTGDDVIATKTRKTKRRNNTSFTMTSDAIELAHMYGILMLPFDPQSADALLLFHCALLRVEKLVTPTAVLLLLEQLMNFSREVIRPSESGLEFLLNPLAAETTRYLEKHLDSKGYSHRIYLDAIATFKDAVSIGRGSQSRAPPAAAAKPPAGKGAGSKFADLPAKLKLPKPAITATDGTVTDYCNKFALHASRKCTDNCSSKRDQRDITDASGSLWHCSGCLSAAGAFRLHSKRK